MISRTALAACSAILAFAARGTGPAYATPFVWTGASGVDSQWSSAANWDTGSPPVPAPDTVVKFKGDRRLDPIQNIANGFTLNSIIFDRDAGTNTRGFTLGGMPVSIIDNGPFPPSIVNDTIHKDASHLIKMDIAFKAKTDITGTGTSPLILGGALSGPGPFTFSGLYRLIIRGSNANTYAGTTEIRRGSVELQKAAGIVAIPGDLDIRRGTVSILDQQQIASSSNVTIDVLGKLQFAPSGTPGIKNQIATLSGEGTVDLGEDGIGNIVAGTLLTGGKGPDSPFKGTLVGQGNLIKTGATNTLVFSGNSKDFTGTIEVKEGILTLDLGAGDSIGTKDLPIRRMDVDGGATLNGIGEIFAKTGVSAGSVGVTIHRGAHLKPGHSPGILTIGSGGLEMKGESVFEEEIDTGFNPPMAGNGPGFYSRLNVNGGTILDVSELEVTLDSPPAPNDLFGIINNMDDLPVSGIFDGLPNDATRRFDGFNFQISYFGNIRSDGVVEFTGGNDVVLRVVASVPEPSSILGLMAGVIAVLGFRPRNVIADVFRVALPGTEGGTFSRPYS